MRIDIDITSEELGARRLRVQRTKSMEEPDRVPVMPYVNSRYWLPRIGVSFKKYFADLGSFSPHPRILKKRLSNFMPVFSQRDRSSEHIFTTYR